MAEPWWKQKIADRVPVWSVLIGLGVVGVIAAVTGISLSGGTGPATPTKPAPPEKPSLKITDKVLFVHSISPIFMVSQNLEGIERREVSIF